MDNSLNYKIVKPDKSLSDFIDSFWMFCNVSESDKELVVLPDERIDLIFYQSKTEPVQVALLGIQTYSDQTILASDTRIFAISFKLLATEYIFPDVISNLLNKAESFPSGFWNFSIEDFNDFDLFCKKSTQIIQSILPKEIDSRKQKLFDLIYYSNGSLTVKELSERVYWSSRQINRYFNQQFGISLKSYCDILRFRVSLKHISEGKLFPEQNFTDQNHFIKNIKKYAGVTPKILSKNKDEKFFYLTTLKNSKN